VGELLLLVGILAVCGFLFWASTLIDPHFVARDGRRFVALAQTVGRDGTTGRWREVRVALTADGSRMVRTRSRRTGGIAGTWLIAGKSADPPRKKAVYLLAGEPDLVLRLPAKSRVVPTLDALTDEGRRPGIS
jgi:hypothetical protein